MAPSPVWLHFTKLDACNVKCLECKKHFKFHKSTTSLAKHLKSAHKIDVKNEKDQNSENSGTVIGPLDKCIKSVSSFSNNGSKQKEMLNALLFMVCKDNMSLRTPQKEGFKLFCKKLQPLYHPPSVITLTSHLCAKYTEIVSKVKKEMYDAHSVCLTTDLWTHRHTMQSYLGLTAHYLKGCDIKSVELGAYEMDERKTSENLSRKLRDVCNEWDLTDEKISAIISDSGANIKAAIKEEFGESKHISCFGHGINNIGQRLIEINLSGTAMEALQLHDCSDEDILPCNTAEIIDDTQTTALRQLLRSVKIIVRFFRSSEIATRELKSLQKEKGDQPCLKLIQEVKTRWNSCYEMLDRFIFLADYVGRVLLQVRRDKSSRAKPPDMVTGAELDALTEVRDILKPLWHITQEISAEKYVTLRKCIPLVVGLRMKINAFEPSTLIGKQLKEKLAAEISNKFHNIEAVRMYTAATLLDPRFKKYAFQNIRDAACAISYVGELVNAEIKNCQYSPESECDVEVIDNAQDKENDDIWRFLGSRVRHRQSNVSVGEEGGIPIQLRHYLSTPTVNRRTNPNPFLAWRAMENEYPNIWKVAEKMLPVVATSVPCERLFSHAGLIANQLRNRISPVHLNMIVFLRSVGEDIWFGE